MNIPKNLHYCSLLCLTILFSCVKDGETGPQGPAGAVSLIDVQTLAPGEECANGGLIIKSGVDKNGNKQLEDGEVDNVKSVCNGNNGDYDKQIIIPLAYTAASTDDYGNGLGMHLRYLNFNISDYKGIDSVVMYSKLSYSGPAGGKAIMSLHNFTDNTIIEGSEITSTYSFNGTVFPYLQSGNFYQNFPKKSIKLGIKVSHENGSALGWANDAYLILFRK